uniref:Glycolate utilization protein n=1 Tax=Thermogemmatispora argillosa TaxID=2045280 RepID=A0A455T646_9CHLR|nr:glycolate utilization protein [Thermogemmatispora argillosa]
MAENSFAKPSITIEAAHRLIAAAEAKAREIGVPMCIAICDADGTLKAFSRMDGAPLLSVQIAQDKAYTAVSFGGMATHEWFEFIKNDPPLLHGIIKTDRLIVFGGGFAIKTAEGIIGGIGVSGGHYTQDMEVAQAALAAL